MIQKKNDNLISQNHDDVTRKRRLYKKLGKTIDARVTLQNGKALSLQQALCAISATGGGGGACSGVEKAWEKEGKGLVEERVELAGGPGIIKKKTTSQHSSTRTDVNTQRCEQPISRGQ